MSRTASPTIAQRNRQIVEDREKHGLSVPELAKKYGRQSPSIRAILRNAGVKFHGKSGSGGPCEIKPISQLHVKVWAKLDAKMSARGQRVSDAAAEIGISERYLVNFRLGATDPTLSQLQLMAAYVGVEPHELIDSTYNISPPKKRSHDS